MIQRLDRGARIRKKSVVDMVRPELPEGIVKADVDALFKRATWVVNTDGSIYGVHAGTDSAAHRYANEGPVLTPNGSATRSHWLKNIAHRDAEALAIAKAGELALLRRLLAQRCKRRGRWCEATCRDAPRACNRLRS